VLQLTAWTGGSGASPEGAGFYLGASGLVANIAESLDLRGAAGVAGMNGIDGMNGSDATPITSITFDGTNLTIQTSTGQSFGPFNVRGTDGTNGSDGASGTNGWSPLFAIIQDGERRVLQLQSWSGGTGSTPGSEGHYLGASGLTPYLYEAVDLRGAQGPAGAPGSNGADATPITGISFDGYNLTIYTSSGQSFGPFYVRGSDGGQGPAGSNGADATPITQITFDGYNLTIYTSSGQSFGPFFVRGNDGSSGVDGTSGNNGWSPLFAIIDDGDRRVLKLQNWAGGSGSTPGWEGYYIGPSGFTPYAYEATDIRGPQGNAGEPGTNGADATPITSIEFDGSNLTIHTSSGQSFGPFYVRGNDGPPGADGSSGGNNGADGANGWSPVLAVVQDGERRVLQLQNWSGGGGSSPGSEGSYLGPYGLTWTIAEAVDIRGNLQPLPPIDNVNSGTALSGSDTVDIAQLEAQIADLQTKLQQVLDRLRSHNLISVN
jgi:hypothetical protein